MAEHSFLSASGSLRWIACAGSAHVEAELPNEPNEHSELGILAHDLSEKMLRGTPFDLSEFDGEMVGYIQEYVAHCNELRTNAWYVGVEERVDFSPWVPGGFGTADFISIKDHTAFIVDLKYGYVRVSAKDNSQLKLYALGVLNEFDYLHRIEKFVCTIVQPRVGHVGVAEYTRDQLVEWAETVAVPAAELALTPNAPRVPGRKQCLYCRARANCGELKRHIETKILGHLEKSSDEIPIRQVVSILDDKPLVDTFFKALSARVYNEIMDGKDVPGRKLVLSKPNRVLSNVNAAIARIREHKPDIKDDDLFKPRQSVSMSALEKLLGKDKNIIAEFINRPDGVPVVASASDSRPAFVKDVSKILEEK